MKGLKKLIVAGRATKTEIWQYFQYAHRAKVTAVSLFKRRTDHVLT